MDDKKSDQPRKSDLRTIIDNHIKDHLANEDDKEIQAATAKSIDRDLSEALAIFRANHKNILSFKKTNIFPYKWMLKDNRILDAMNRCEKFLPLMNYLHNRNRYIKGKKREDMVEKADKLTNKRRYLEQHIFSTFFTDRQFYEEVTEAIDISENSVKRYIVAFVKIGILKTLYVGNHGRLYADGFFVTRYNRLTKKTFLIDDPVIRTGLRELPNNINKYSRNRI